MLFTTIALAIAECAHIRSVCCGLIAIAVKSLGWFIRTAIAELGSGCRLCTSGFLFFDGIVLIAAERTGCGVQSKWIAFACIVMFNLNFWRIIEAQTPQP